MFHCHTHDRWPKTPVAMLAAALALKMNHGMRVIKERTVFYGTQMNNMNDAMFMYVVCPSILLSSIELCYKKSGLQDNSSTKLSGMFWFVRDLYRRGIQVDHIIEMMQAFLKYIKSGFPETCEADWFVSLRFNAPQVETPDAFLKKLCNFLIVFEQAVVSMNSKSFLMTPSVTFLPQKSTVYLKSIFSI